MRNALLTASAFCGLAAALPQKINIAAALAVPTPTAGLGPKVTDPVPPPVTYDQAAATESAAQAVATGGIVKGGVSKRDIDDACAPQPDGTGTVPGDGSVAAYLDTTNALRSAAQTAATPSGYKKEFTDLILTTEQIGYLTYKVIADGTYGVQQCADFCDSEKFCLGFNIYFERDPSLNPAAGCTNPDPVTNTKCAIFGYPVSQNSVINKGQSRQQFQVVMVGSNGYSKTSPTCKAAPSVPDFNAPSNLAGAINAPLVQKNGQDYDPYNGMRLFNDGPFDPSLCAAACEAQTEFDHDHLADANGQYKPCNFFNAYILTKNGVPLGTYCSFYTQSFDSTYAVNTGYGYNGDEYSVVCSASYDITVVDSGVIAASP